jgi:hypothetical protein
MRRPISSLETLQSLLLVWGYMQMPTFPLIWSISQSDELIMTYARHELYYPVVAFWTNEGTLGGFSFHDWLNDDNPSSRWIESMMPPPLRFSLYYSRTSTLTDHKEKRNSRNPPPRTFVSLPSPLSWKVEFDYLSLPREQVTFEFWHLQ